MFAVLIDISRRTSLTIKSNMREESSDGDGDGNGIGRQTGRKEILSNVDA